jgi:hypothetical protein
MKYLAAMHSQVVQATKMAKWPRRFCSSSKVKAHLRRCVPNIRVKDVS